MRELLFYLLLPVAVLLILRNPFTGVALYVGVNIIRPEMLFWGGRQGDIAYKILLGAAFVSLFKNNPTEFFRPLRVRELWLLIFTWGAVMISLQFSPFPLAPRAMYYAEEILKLAFLAWLLLAALKERESIELFEKIYLLLFSILGLWGVEQHFRGNERLENFPLGDSNGVAAILVLAVPVALNMALHGTDKKNRRLGLLAVVILALAIISTQSRGGFLGMSAATAVFFIWSRRKKALLVLVAAVVTVALLFAPESYFHRLSTLQAEEEEIDHSAGSRLVLWQAGMMIFKDNPWVGVGFMAFPQAKMLYRDSVKGDENLISYTFNEDKVAHNTYVQVLSEGGLLLAVPYFLLIIGTFTGNWRVRRMRGRKAPEDPLVNLLNGIEAGIAGFCICIIFINAITTIFLPLQIIVSRCIRDYLYASHERLPDGAGGGGALNEDTVPSV